MSLFSRLFGTKETPQQEPVVHKGFSIFADPLKDGPHWRVAARIEKDVGGEIKVHRLIRADTLESQDTAAEASVEKAKQMIDEQGESIFR